jgi:hypothetical protein
MGSWTEFKCVKCGYRAEVSGGKDCGMVAVVETMVCQSCRQLVDVLIGRCGIEGPTGDSEYDKDLGLCPECRSGDVSVWQEPRPCPKCDGQMIEGRPTALWD